ncbi:MAG: hypothetical protein WAU73_28900 [Candidatus Sulfotelmatobacter sp.]
MIPQCVINDLVTGVGEDLLRVHGPAVCSKVLDLLKIRSSWAGLPANLEIRSADDAALATALTTCEGMVAGLSTLDIVAPSMLPRRLAEASQAINALLHDSAVPVSANHWSSQTECSWVPKDAQSGAKGERFRDDANRQQFQVALLENCSFFADLVLRHVRAEGNPSGSLLERDWSRKKLNGVRILPTLLRSKANVALNKRPEKQALPPESPSSLLQTLWVEVGCRHVQTLVSEEEHP